MHELQPIEIPAEWSDSGLLTFEEFCHLIRTPQRTVRDWRQRGVGPVWARLDGGARLYITVREARRFINTAAIAPNASTTAGAAASKENSHA